MAAFKDLNPTYSGKRAHFLSGSFFKVQFGANPPRTFEEFSENWKKFGLELMKPTYP